MTDPVVSVILCTYQQVDFIGDAVRSVLEQEYDRLELIVIDNGSTDETAEFLSEVDDERVRLLLHKKNLAVTQRLNEGVAASSGPLISLLYGDDLYLPAKLATQVAAFREAEDGVGVVYGPGLRRNILTGDEWPDRTVTGSGDILSELLLARGNGCFINPISPLVRRECFEQHPFYEDIFVEGENHYYRVATTHKFLYLPEPLVVMREHNRNMGKVVRRNCELLDEALRRLEQAPTLPSGALGDVRRARADLHRRLAWVALRVAEDPAWARRCLRCVARIEPLQLLRAKTVATGVLSLLSQRQLRLLNQLGYRLHQPREVVGIRDHY